MSIYSNDNLGCTQAMGYGAACGLGLIGAGILVAGLIAHHTVVSLVGGGVCITAATVAGCVRIRLKKMEEANEQPSQADQTITYSYIKPNSTVIVGDGWRNGFGLFENKESTSYVPVSSMANSYMRADIYDVHAQSKTRDEEDEKKL